MNRVFADTFYYLAMLNSRDAAHQWSRAFSATTGVATVTTSWVLTEVGDAMTGLRRRSAFLFMLADLRRNPLCTIVRPSQKLFDQGLDLYSPRLDKDWSLTDCISFVVMEEHGLHEALTGDRHFEQAGYRALFAKEDAP